MADCGASGSIIDRAVSGWIASVTGASTDSVVVSSNVVSQANKALTNMISGMALSGAANSIIPPSLMLESTPRYIEPEALSSPLSRGSMIQSSAIDLSRENRTASIPSSSIFQTAVSASRDTTGDFLHSYSHPHFIQSNYGSSFPISQQQIQIQMMYTMNAMNQEMVRMQTFQRQRESEISTKQKVVEEVPSRQIPNNHHISSESYAYPSEFNDFFKTNEEWFNDEYGGSSEDVTVEQLNSTWRELEQKYLAHTQLNPSGMYVQEMSDIDSMYPYEFSKASRLFGFSDQTRPHPTGMNSQLETNAMKVPELNLMAEGMKFFQRGDITKAISCFESELQNVDPDNADAWLMLGKCHAENDEDQKAICCLERAVERNPYSPDALLAVGVSCVNELLYERALIHLKNWVTHNPNYSTLEWSFESIQTNYRSELSSLEDLKYILRKALDADMMSQENNKQQRTADVLEALGVVCNVSQEWDDAVNYLRSATNLRRSDYQLWNKLGATLANSNRSDEALQAYQHALSLKPRYARAWLNMAIAHSNLQNYHEAVRCYLQTLSLNPSATHVWSYLRIALTALERWDLMPLISDQNLLGFKDHFEFVQYS